MQEGIDGHARLEAHFKGQPTQLTLTEGRVLELLPKRADAESELLHLSLAGIQFQGSMDLVQGTDVYDYKYQSRVKKFDKPTVQVIGYLEEIRRRCESLPGTLSFHFVLIPKAGGTPIKQTFSFTAEEIKAAWEAYAPVVREMQEAALVKDADQVACDPAACYKYGPCPYLGICNKGNQTGDYMSFLDKLNEAKKEQASVELPEVNAEPTESQKLQALLEASIEIAKDQKKESIRPPEVQAMDREYDGYQKTKKPDQPIKIKAVEVRHQVTFDIKKDGVFSATVGIALAADVPDGDEEKARLVLSDKIMQAIKLEAAKYGR